MVDCDVRARSPPPGRGAPGRLAAGRPLGLGTGRPLRARGSSAASRKLGVSGNAAPLPGASAVGGAPGAVPAEQRAQQPRPALLRRAQPARAGAGREEGAHSLQEVRGAWGRGGLGKVKLWGLLQGS